MKNRFRTFVYLLIVVGILLLQHGCVEEKKNAPVGTGEKKCSLSESRWWPILKAPEAIVKTTNHEEFEKVVSEDGEVTEGAFGETHMMIQSVAGVVAKAVNEGRCDEMVWIEVGHPTMGINAEYAEWYKRIVNRFGLKERGQFESWDLVKRYIDKGIIKGYILYSFDHKDRIEYPNHPDYPYDPSVNVATTLAGFYDAIIVSEAQEAKARELGLKKLFDARGRDMAWCFNKYSDKLNRDIMLTVDVKAPNNRAMAIATKCISVLGLKEPVPQMFEWLNPLSPLMGWNWVDEGHHVSLASEYALFQTACNWSLNMPATTAGSEYYDPKKIKALNPGDIDFDETDHAVTFIMSDGDNVQWLMGDFIRSKYYWGNPHHGEFPMGWTGCLANLKQICPYVLDNLAETQPEQTGFVEFAGGYYYPDIFGAKRNGKDLLAKHARRISDYMKATGAKVFGFICQDLDSEGAKKAYKIFAENIDDIYGMIAIQYHPYEGGKGKIYWAENKDGVEIPVVTAKYALWANSNTERKGTPARVARLINKAAEGAEKAGKKELSWVTVHAWSAFEKAEGKDEDAENLEAGDKGQFGISPVKWCVERLDNKVRVVTPEELIWRIRMDHNPEQTKAEIDSLQ